jgi:hypothetical protein
MGARDDIPRERLYYRPGSEDPVRANSPFTPSTGNDGSTMRLPLVGVLVVGGLILLLEHFRKGR